MIATGSIHYAKIGRSPRLQRLLAFLRTHPGGVTTREIIQGADVCAVNSAVCELRRNDFTVDAEAELVPSTTGARVYRYTLRESREAVQGTLFEVA